ncbi:hypothetical protein [Paludibacterium purpuratum]|uniref:Uncharacterized protein n=1 Tax=Paludibacterium purpuratum TaxID=1144873 RepID=A0A4R7BEG7_9NEIS|nr:hypothetical protein [Paludibacterium purpuratum]TDR82156.1 hypothetical protein DFP86_102270 [Paludibacterium purpuratum]
MSEIATFEHKEVRVSAPLPILQAIMKSVFEPPVQPMAKTSAISGLVLHPGETYAGLLLNEETGEPAAHLILVAMTDTRRGWAEQKEWALGAGGKLPNRQEGALLYANLKRLFKDAWHWLETECSEDYADEQYFGNGDQSDGDKGCEGFAVAVRLIPVTDSSL